MEQNELLSQISAAIEQFGVKDQLKNPETVDKLYGMLSANGLQVNKDMFNTIVQGFVNSDAKLTPEMLLKIGQESGLLGGEGLKDGLQGLAQLFSNTK